MSDPTAPDAPAKVPLLFFSGGMDSTLLLAHYLKTTDVDVIYAFGGQGQGKIDGEAKARQAIFDFFDEHREEYPFKIRQKLTFDTHNAWHDPQTRNIGLVQPMAWMTAALGRANFDEHSEVMIAYIFGDDAHGFVHHMKAMWENAWSIFKTTEMVPLRFPLLEKAWRKERVIHDLDPRLLALTWVCEHQGKDKCLCIPCRKVAHVMADFPLHHGASYNKIAKAWIKAPLKTRGSFGDWVSFRRWEKTSLESSDMKRKEKKK